MPTGSSMAFSQPLGILNSGVINLLSSQTFQQTKKRKKKKKNCLMSKCCCRINSLLPKKELRCPSPNVLGTVTNDFLKPLTGIETASPKISTPPPEIVVSANAGQKLKSPKQNRCGEEEATATPEEISSAQQITMASLNSL
nr:hypothetical protein Iba_chr03dCG1610 [Ipomoea batatas]